MLNPSLLSFSGTMPADLLTPSTLKSLQKQLTAYEAQAAQTGSGFCVFSLQPDLLLYTSDLFADITGLELQLGEHLPLSVWLKQLPACIDEQQNFIKPMLVKLLREFMLNPPVKLIVDYGRQTRNGFRRLEESIAPILLSQSSPRHLFWCWTHPIDHLNTRFAYTLTLVHNQDVIEKTSWCPPLDSHPLLKDLSPTEVKVLNQLLRTEETRLIADTLNLGHETVKTHRRNIIQKTGHKSTDALVAVLKQEMSM